MFSSFTTSFLTLLRPYCGFIILKGISSTAFIVPMIVVIITATKLPTLSRRKTGKIYIIFPPTTTPAETHLTSKRWGLKPPFIRSRNNDIENGIMTWNHHKIIFIRQLFLSCLILSFFPSFRSFRLLFPFPIPNRVFFLYIWLELFCSFFLFTTIRIFLWCAPESRQQHLIIRTYEWMTEIHRVTRIYLTWNERGRTGGDRSKARRRKSPTSSSTSAFS